MRTYALNLLLLSVFTAVLPAYVAAEETTNGYQLGRGYALGETGIRLGGYASTQISVPRHSSWSYELSDLSLFLTWDNGGRLHFFSELEAGDLLSANQQHSLGVQNVHFEFERCYLDTLVNNHVTLRLGKFLTPIGQWNVIHAAPLVWTSARPVATENLFSTHATGLMLHGSATLNQQLLEYSVFGDATEHLDSHRSDTPFENAAGLHLRYFVSDKLQLGMSYANFVLNDFQPKRHHLAGLDLTASYQGYELSSEMLYRSGKPGYGQTAWQGFVQGVAPVYNKQWFVVARYEFFQQAQDGLGQTGLLGMAYRPLPPLIWKLDYRLGTNNANLAADGFSTSIAILF